MRVIGLTGGIGSGKSTVSRILEQEGFALIDADRIAHEMTEPGQSLVTELGAVFGSGIIRKNGELDRKALGAIVFGDSEKKNLLDKMMHGKIKEEIRRQKEAYRNKGAHRGILIDAPLLFETGLDRECDIVWLVTAREEVRICRVCERDGLAPEEVRARIHSQMDDGEKRRRSQVILDNSGNLEALRKQVLQLARREGSLA